MVPDACRVGVCVLRGLIREIEGKEQGILNLCAGSLVARLCLLEGLPTRPVETGLQQSRLGLILSISTHTDELRIDGRAPARGHRCGVHREQVIPRSCHPIGNRPIGRAQQILGQRDGPTNGRFRHNLLPPVMPHLMPERIA